MNLWDKTILIDIDGVLTDGKINIDHTGEKLFKSFHSRDVQAIRELIWNGYRVILVSSDDHPCGRHFADKVGAEFVYEREKGKLGKSWIAVGDSAIDIPMLKQARHAFQPNDGALKEFDFPKLKTKGGEGVISEIVDKLQHLVS